MLKHRSSASGSEQLHFWSSDFQNSQFSCSDFTLNQASLRTSLQLPATWEGRELWEGQQKDILRVSSQSPVSKPGVCLKLAASSCSRTHLTFAKHAPHCCLLNVSEAGCHNGSELDFVCCLLDTVLWSLMICVMQMMLCMNSTAKTFVVNE